MRSLHDRTYHGVGRGFTLLEVVIALAIMLAGLAAVVAAYPSMLTAQREAEILTVAAALAQQKAEEIRRDNDVNNRLIQTIRTLESPTRAIVFPQEPRLVYQFCGRSLEYAPVNPADPRSYDNVPRVIVSYNPEFRESGDVVYELRFDR